MQWKMFWPVFGGSLAIATALVPAAFGVAWWLTVAIVVALSLIMLMSVGSIVHRADMFDQLKIAQRDRVTMLVRLPIGAYGLWTVLFVAVPQWWPQLSLAMALLLLATYWGCKAEEYWLTRPKKPAPETPELTDAQVLAQNPTVRQFRPVLNRAGHAQVKITGHEPVTDESGTVVAQQFRVQTPATGR